MTCSVLLQKNCFPLILLTHIKLSSNSSVELVLFASSLAMKPMLLLHQCMEHEWAAWGRDSAAEMAAAGVVVMRVFTDRWQDMKILVPSAFENVYKASEHEQQMICTVNYIHRVLPILPELQVALEEDRNFIGYLKRSEQAGYDMIYPKNY